MKKILCIIVGMLCLLPLGAKVKLPAIIGNDMVLQQNTNVNLWGWATRSRKITVRTSWDNKNYTTRVRDKDCVKNRVKRAKIVRFTLC